MKRITMTVYDGNSSVDISESFSSEATWSAIAYQFFNFLRAQGYYLDSDDVGASVEDYVAGQHNDEE